jgi:hypothetical protein
MLDGCRLSGWQLSPSLFEEGGPIPGPRGETGTLLDQRLGGLSEYPRHQGLQPLPHVLTDLYCQHLGRVHLTVQELHDPSELGRDDIGHKHQANPASLQVRLDLLPKIFRSFLPDCESVL